MDHIHNLNTFMDHIYNLNTFMDHLPNFNNYCLVKFGYFFLFLVFQVLQL